MKRYTLSQKGRAAVRRYRESPEGRAAIAAAHKRYMESPKGQAAYARAKERARERYALERARAQTDAERRELRRSRIVLGLPPEPQTGRTTDARRGFTEKATIEALRPEYIAAALALEDLL